MTASIREAGSDPGEGLFFIRPVMVSQTFSCALQNKVAVIARRPYRCLVLSAPLLFTGERRFSFDGAPSRGVRVHSQSRLSIRGDTRIERHKRKRESGHH